MDNNIRYRNYQYGNDDYAQLDRWSGLKGTPTNDNASLIYTSDYGSYSSQESNHSGTTYSNLADCEEALHSPPSAAYDVPPPHLYSSMERRRDKPLPPPRMTSKPQNNPSNKVQESGKPKKISFDDSSMNKKPKSNENVPSFATLPRKKKLGGSTTTPSQSTTQVTWMKDVAQKAEIIHHPTSTESGNSSKKPHGILKNKIEEQAKKGDVTGYIQRDKVQKILARQRKALCRQSTPSTSQFYNSMPSLRPTNSEPQQQTKAWEYNHMGNGTYSSGGTAQVIGVIEPNAEPTPQQLFCHRRQNSNETEFEFPPPPTDYDIEQIMTSPDTTISRDNEATRKKDFTPLNLACNKQSTSNVQGIAKLFSAQTARVTVKDPKFKPPVPQRMSKPSNTIIQGQTNDAAISKTEPRVDSISSSKATIPKAIVPPRRISVQNKPQPPAPPRKLSKPKSINDQSHNLNFEQVNDITTEDIVLPPPPQFQENPSLSPLATQQPSYGDYELLSPEAEYQCSQHPLATNYIPATLGSNNQYNYHQRIAINQLGKSVTENLKVTEAHNAPPPPPPKTREFSYSPLVSHNINGYPPQPSYYNSSKYQPRSRIINHQHQYSTEL